MDEKSIDITKPKAILNKLALVIFPGLYFKINSGFSKNLNHQFTFLELKTGI